MSRFQFVEDHQDTYEVKQLRAGRGGTLIALRLESRLAGPGAASGR